MTADAVPGASAVPVPVSDAKGSLILQARQVTKRFGGLVAVRGVDFDIPAGSIVSLIGPNGAGKTTFFNVIAGLIDPTQGGIDFLGERMVARPVRAWAEPIFWFAVPVPVLVVGILAIGSGLQTAGELLMLAALGLLVASLLSAVVRPRWYVRVLRRAGMFRSARP